MDISGYASDQTVMNANEDDESLGARVISSSLALTSIIDGNEHTSFVFVSIHMFIIFTRQHDTENTRVIGNVIYYRSKLFNC